MYCNSSLLNKQRSFIRERQKNYKSALQNLLTSTTESYKEATRKLELLRGLPSTEELAQIEADQKETDEAGVHAFCADYSLE